jgi:hypothetical protein
MLAVYIMFLITLKTIFIYLLLISLIHYLYVFLKNTLTVPKIKDLVNKPIRDYNDMFDIIAKDRGMGQNNMGQNSMNINNMNSMNMDQQGMGMGQNNMGMSVGQQGMNMGMDQNSMNMGPQGMGMGPQGMGMGQQSMHLELKQFLNDLKSKS